MGVYAPSRTSLGLGGFQLALRCPMQDQKEGTRATTARMSDADRAQFPVTHKAQGTISRLPTRLHVGCSARNE